MKNGKTHMIRKPRWDAPRTEACDMIYKPEHVTDLENGAIVQVEVLEGDYPDTKALSERVACAVEVVNRT